MVLSVWALTSSPSPLVPPPPPHLVPPPMVPPPPPPPLVSSPGQAVGRHESLTGHNMEKKAKWRLEYQQEAAAAGKAQ